MQDTKSTFLGGFYFIAPAVAMFALFHPSIGFVPAQLVSNGDPMAPWAAAIVGLVPGYILYKRAVTVRGHEWHRLQAIKKLSRHYKNERSEVWNQDSNLTLTTPKGSVQVGNLTQNALDKMQGKIGDLIMDNTEAGNEIDFKQDIQFLADKKYVNLAASRVSGSTSIEKEKNKITYSDDPKSSVMDRILDWFALKLSNKKKQDNKKIENFPHRDIQQENNNLSLGASNYEQSISSSWHCRSCGNINPIDSTYCEICGSTK